MTIKSIETNHYQIPLPVVLSDSTHGDIHHFDLITARITTEDGASGFGYTYCVGHGGSAINALARESYAPVLIGEDEGRIEHCWQKMWWAVHFAGRGAPASFAMAALDVALWDLAGKRANLPLWRMLGGHNRAVKTYAGGIDLLFPLEQLLEQTRDNLNRGFKAIKMKIGRDNLSEDVARVAAMREFLGPDFPLMADANMRWRRDQAIAAFQKLAPYNLTWLEEPLAPDDFEGHSMLAKFGVPIAAGENLHTVSEFQQIIAAGGVHFPEPDLATVAGITGFMKVARLAEANHLPITSHGVHDLHVHVLAAIPNASYLEWHGFGLERFIEQPLEIEEDGTVLAPERPGHGVAFDWEALAEFEVKSQT